jgi:hypothetical protein
LETKLFFLSVELLRCLDYGGHSFLILAAISRVVAECIQMIKFATTTDASLTEIGMWCLQLIGGVVHIAKTLAKSTDEALRFWEGYLKLGT